MRSLVLLLSLAMILSCNKDDDTMDISSCTDGIQNGNETGVDCGGDCGTCETTVEEDKANVDQTFDDLLTCTMEIRDSRSFTELFKNFLNMSDGEMLNEAWVEDVTEGLEAVFDFEDVEDNMRFDLSHHAGTHVFNQSNSSWTKMSDVSDKVILKFPSEPNVNVNNVELIMDTYTDQLVNIDGESMSLPKTMHVSVNIDAAKAFEFTLSKVTYAENSGSDIPVELDASLFMDPITLNVDVNRLSSTSFDMGMTLINDGKCDMSINSQFELKDDNFDNLEMNSFESAAVQVNLGQLSFRTTGDLAGLLAIEEPTEAQVNSMMDLDLFYNDFKIADIESKDDLETLLLFYKDGSSENTDDLFQDIEELLEDFF